MALRDGAFFFILRKVVWKNYNTGGTIPTLGHGSKVYIINRPKRRNPPCAAPSLSSFPMGKKLDTTQRGASQGGIFLLGQYINMIRLALTKNNHVFYCDWRCALFLWCKVFSKRKAEEDSSWKWEDAVWVIIKYSFLLIIWIFCKFYFRLSQ